MADWVSTVINFYYTIGVYAITWGLGRKVLTSIVNAVTDGEVMF